MIGSISTTEGDTVNVGTIVRTPRGAVGIVIRETHFGNFMVRLPLVDLAFPYHPSDLLPVLQDHDPSGRGCALAGRARDGHAVPWSDTCGPCYLDRNRLTREGDRNGGASRKIGG